MYTYANELDKLTCSAPGCGCGGLLYFHSSCHPRQPTWARYAKGAAVLELLCAKCGAIFAEFALPVQGG